MKAVGKSEKGLREENQDSFFLDLESGIFMVADGMGGHNAGQIASSIAIESAAAYLIKEFNNNVKNLKDTILTAFKEANQKIFQYSSQYSNAKGMGTTLTTICVKDTFVYLGHIGDSRGYLIKAGEITQLTNDHSYVGELLRSGGLSEEEAIKHPQRNLLTKALGSSDNLDMDIMQYKLDLNDYILLCTDGLFSMLSDKELYDIVMKENLDDAVQSMVELALNRGSGDNITAVLVHNI